MTTMGMESREALATPVMHVGQAGAQVAHGHGGLVGDPGVAVGGGGGDGLVPGADIVQLLAAGQGVQHADDRVAAQAEDILHVPPLQVIDDQVCYQFLAHNTSSCF